jgi:hypothetical protein
MLSNLRSRVNHPRSILKSNTRASIKSPLHESITFVLESDSESSDDSDGYVAPKPTSGLSVKFALHAPPSPIPSAQSKEDIEKALAFLPYPLSPYPRSFSKDKKAPSQGKENNVKGEGRREAKRTTSLAVPAPQGRTVTPARPAQSRRVLRRPAELNLAEPPLLRPPGLGPVLSSVPESPALTEIRLDVPSSVTPSGGRSEGSSELSAAFWLSVSVEEIPEDELAPTSPFLFGRKDGSVWSPGLPRKTRASASDGLLLASIFSPGPAAETFDAEAQLAGLTSPAPHDPIAGFTSFTTALNVEKHFAAMTSPAPHDPAATFASFSAALAYLGSDPVITYPPSVELRAGRMFTR